MCLLPLSWAGARHKNRLKICEYFSLDMNISIESYKWLQNYSNPKQKLFYYVIQDAFISKGVSNDEMGSQDHQFHLRDTDPEKH